MVLFATTVESSIMELSSRFLVSHIMDAMGICYPLYWLQTDVEDNFNYHLELIKSHYCTEWHLEPIKLSSTSLEMARDCPSILSTSGLVMQVSIFKITLKSNVVAAMELPFHVNPLT